ncbi:MAG: hypothetical protein NVSMB66_0040 [Candidatus Doudnabacteria bacterium]
MIKRYENKKENAFTLIELLVVISIIGILTSIILVALGNGRQKSRIAKRIADLKQMQGAIEQYYGANQGFPNTTAGIWRTECVSWNANIAQYSSANVVPGLVPTYVAIFPSDPSMKVSTHENCYLYQSDGNNYKLLDYNVTDMSLADLQKYPEMKDPLRSYDTSASQGCAYNGDAAIALSVSSRGAQCW